MKKRTVITFFSVCFAVGVICMVARNVIEREKVTINNRYIYSEQSIPGFQTDKQYVRNIMDYLDNYYVENQGFFLSMVNDYSVFSKLYANYMILENSIELTESYRHDVGKSFEFFRYNICNYNIPIYDYIYYVALGSELGYPVNYEELTDKIKDYTDPDTGLLFYLSTEDSIDVKLLISAKVVELCKRYSVPIELNMLCSKIIQQSENIKLKQPEDGDTFYNSGGIYFYAVSATATEFEINDSFQKWFQNWQYYYSNFEIQDEYDFVEYVSFCDAGRIFDFDGTKKLIKYIDSYNFEDIGNVFIDVIDVVNYMLPYIEQVENDSFAKAFQIAKDNINKLQEENNKSNVIDIASTYYGCTIAYELGMDIDVVQCRKEIENNYLTELEQCFEQTDAESESGFTHDTYYYVMFKQSFEPEKIDEGVSKKITEKLDDVIEHILAGDTADVVTLRYALEVKANLDSYIYQDALEKISGLLNELYQTKGEYNSRFIDAIKIDMILRLNIFDKQFANKLKQALYRDGGFACKEGETADLKTTYQFYSLISTSELFTITDDEVAQMKQFLSTVDAAGIYSYSTEDTYVDFRSIYYGNTLSNFTLGGKSE